MIVAAAPGLGRLLGHWTLDPVLAVALVASAALYLLGVRRVRRGWPALRSVSFLAGLAVIAVALLSDVDAYADSLLSVHMAQHMLLVMVAPVLLAWGAPVRLALLASPAAVRRRIAALLHRPATRVLLHPLTGSLAVCALLLGTHFSGLFALTLRDPTVHELEHAALLLCGLVLFVPLVAADPLPRAPSALARLGSLTLVMTAMVVVGAVLSFQGSVRYGPYLQAARALHVSALSDQRLGGVVMWFGGGILGAILTVVLVGEALFAEERRQRRRERYALPREAELR